MSRTNSLTVSSTLAILFLVLPVYASHHFPDYPVRPAGEYANKVEKAGLIVAVEPMEDPNQQKTYFNSHLGSNGILPVLNSTSNPNVLTRAARSADQGSAPSPAGLKIILLKPFIHFENWNCRKGCVPDKSPKVRATEEAYGRLLSEAARKGVGSKATLLDVETLEASVVQACGKLDPLASRLARGDVNEEAIGDLARLSAFDEQYAVLVQFLRLKTGSHPEVGLIGNPERVASTLVQAALLFGKTGKVIWKGERLVRKNLKPTDADFGKALTLLYRSFDIK